MNKQSTVAKLLEIKMPAESLRLVLQVFEDFSGSQPEPSPILPFSEERADPIKARLNALYNRRATTRWSAKELSAYKKAQIAEEDLQVVERARQLGYQFFRRDIFTLLNNWGAEVDRSRAFILEEAPYKHQA